jgi:hypothetical protein
MVLRLVLRDFHTSHRKGLYNIKSPVGNNYWLKKEKNQKTLPPHRCKATLRLKSRLEKREVGLRRLDLESPAGDFAPL